MRAASAFLIASVAVVGGACHILDVSGSSSISSCPVSLVINAGIGISDYKQRIARQTAVAPADSVLDVVLVFVSAVSQVDRDAIATYGGANVASGGDATSLKAEFRAQDLATYVANDNGRLSNAVIFIPACVA